MADLDPKRADMSEQRIALQCIRRASLTCSAVAMRLARLMDWTPSNADAGLSKMMAGKRTMGVGLWRAVLLELDDEGKLALARGLLDGSGLVVTLEDHDDLPDDLPSESMDVLAATMAAARADVAGCGSPEAHRQLSDRHQRIAAAYAALASAMAA